MATLCVISFISLLSTGLLAGIFAGNRLGASLALPTIPVSSFVQFQQVVHRSYVKFMPILQIAAILSGAAWLFELRGGPSAGHWPLLAAAVAGHVVIFAVTLTVNVPINKKLMTWSVSGPPENARAIWRPWETGNTIRALLAVIVLMLQLSMVV